MDFKGEIMKNRSSKAGFGVAAVWFGSHCGGGFATGTLAASYYVRYGAWAIFMPLIALAIMCIVGTIQWEICRSNKVEVDLLDRKQICFGESLT